MTEPKEVEGGKDRREVLKRVGRFVAVSAPTVTLLMAAKTKSAKALPNSQQQGSSRQFKIGEGAVDTAAVLAAVASGSVVAATINPIDGVGVCLAAVKGLAERMNRLEIQTAAL